MPKINNKQDQLPINKQINSSRRPSSVNSTKGKDKIQPAPKNKKNLFSNLAETLKKKTTTSDKEKSDAAKNKNTQNQKEVKIIDNSLDHKDDIDFLNSMQEQGNIMDVNVNNHFNNFKNNNENKNHNADLHFHLPLTPEIKVSPNITEINDLIANSQQALQKQNNILRDLSEFNKKFSASETEIQKLTEKLNSEEFAGFSDKYVESLDKVIDKLKNHSEEMENIKFIKEENKNLKYKLEIMNIDKNDVALVIEAKINSIKNFIVNEMNDYIDTLGDIGFEVVDAKIKADQYNEDNIKAYFENLKKMMRNIKAKFNDNDNKINCLNSDKLNLEDEIRYFKSKVESMHKKNLQSDPNLHFYIRQQYEEELDYYKHQNFELQKKLQELRFGSYQYNSNNKPQKEECNNKIKFSENPTREAIASYHINLNKNNNTNNYISVSEHNNLDDNLQVNRDLIEQKYSNTNNNYENVNFNGPIEDRKDLSQSFKFKPQKNVNNEDKKYSDSRSYRSQISNVSNKNIKGNKDKENNYSEEMTKNLSYNKHGFINNNNPFVDRENNKNEELPFHNINGEHNRNHYENRTENFNAPNDDLEYYRKNKGVRNSGSYNFADNYSNNLNQKYNANSFLNSNEFSLENKYSDNNFYKIDNVYYSNTNENYPTYYNY